MKARTIVSVMLLCALVGALLVQVPGVRGVSSTVVISQVYGGGGNSGATLTNDFIELFNRGNTTINLAGWTVQYASAGGTTWLVTPLSGSIAPGQYYLVQQAAGAGGTTPLPAPDATGNTAMSATAGKVALVNNSTALAGACPISAVIVDSIGYGITANCSEGTPTANLSNTTAALRNDGGCVDTDNNVANFTIGAPNPRNTASPFHSCGTGPTGVGAANPNEVAPGGGTLLTVTVTPGSDPTSTGITVTGDLTAIGGSAMQAFFDDATNGDVTAGDNIFSFQATVSAGTSGGAKSLPVVIKDSLNRTGNANIALTVTTPAAVGMVISQVYGGGGNAGAELTHDFIELFNRGTAPIDISGWSVQYNSAAGTGGWQVTGLSGVVQPGQYYLVRQAQGTGGITPLPPHDATGGINMSATAGRVALVRTSTGLPAGAGCPASTMISDFVGYGGTASCAEGAAPTAAPSNTTAVLRRQDGCRDTDHNNSDFVVGAPAPRNTASPFKDCFALAATGEAAPSLLDPGATTLLKVTVSPGNNPTSTGIQVVGDLTSLGGSATQAFFDDGTNGDATAGDNIFSFSQTIPAAATPGDKSVPVNVTDAQGRSAQTTIDVLVVANLKIHGIQGSGSESPFVGLVVRTEGVVTGVKSNGFFMQLPDGEVDGDSQTSEGIFVFTSSAPPAAGSGLGNRVRVLATVAEFRPDPLAPSTTELLPAPGMTVTLLSSGNPLPTATTLTGADTAPGGGHQQIERFEGMRVHVPSMTVVSPTDGFVSESSATSTSNGRFFGVITSYDRPFLEQGIHIFDPLPAGAPCCVPRFDGNPERLRVQSGPTSLGGIGSAVIDVAAGDILTDLTGPLEYAFRTWTILPEAASAPGISPMAAVVPVPVAGSNEYTVGSFNMERFYDTVDGPGSDAILSSAGFERRLAKASLAIRNVMRSPDIIGVQEVENLTTLQTLADRINSDAASANIHYEAFLVEGNDVGGIDVGFLVNTRRVQVIDVTQEGKDTTFIDPNTSVPALLNDRPPLVLRAEILSPQPPNTRITVIVNHLRSLNGINDPADGNRVRHKRRAQAEFLANHLQALQAAEPNQPIIVVGDFNAFQFSDGYVDSMGTITGMPAPGDQVVLSSSDLVNPDLLNLVEHIDESERYSFMFDGNAQVLDHILITANLLESFSRFHYARGNANFPEVLRSDETRPERISDHDMPVAYFFVQPIPVQVDIRPGTFPNSINLGSNGVVPVAILSSPDFDAGQVDPATVELASAPVKLRGNGSAQSSLQDINGDGLRDLVVHVVTSALQLTAADTEAKLTAMTFDGRRVRGKDSVRIVPQK